VDLLERVAATGLLRAPLIVLLSGGRDSVCLLDVAVEALGAASVRALHVDYGLRGDASDGDREYCVALGDRLGVAVVVERARRPPDAAGNFHAWARDVRYGVAADLSHGGWVATGHTATDQVETVLYRLASSPGRRALLGMTERSGRLVRPLLGVTREETAAWCRERGLPWREDASNDDPMYARARVRRGLAAALREVDPRAEANVLRTLDVLREEAEVLDGVVATVLDGRDTIALAHLGALPRALARLVLRRLAEDATGKLCPRAPGRLDDVLALEDGALDLGHGARAVVHDGVLRVAPTPPLPASMR
jgi:tRNA(Ile)-lysidine synthase